MPISDDDAELEELKKKRAVEYVDELRGEANKIHADNKHRTIKEAEEKEKKILKQSVVENVVTFAAPVLALVAATLTGGIAPLAISLASAALNLVAVPLKIRLAKNLNSNSNLHKRLISSTIATNAIRRTFELGRAFERFASAQKYGFMVSAVASTFQAIAFPLAIFSLVATAISFATAMVAYHKSPDPKAAQKCSVVGTFFSMSASGAAVGLAIGAIVTGAALLSNPIGLSILASVLVTAATIKAAPTIHKFFTKVIKPKISSWFKSKSEAKAKKELEDKVSNDLELTADKDMDAELADKLSSDLENTERNDMDEKLAEKERVEPESSSEPQLARKEITSESLSPSQNKKTEPDELDATNFVSFDFYAGGGVSRVAGLAHPERYNDSTDMVIKGLSDVGYDTLISLECNCSEIGAKFTQINDSKKHIEIPIASSTTISADKCLQVCDIIQQESQEGRKVAIHCDKGYGNTAIVLAALAMQESFEKQLKENPKSFLDIDRQLEKNHEVISGIYPSEETTMVSSGVQEAMEKIREAKSRMTGTKIMGQAIENKEQIEVLISIEKELAHKYKQQYDAMPQNEEVKVLTSALGKLNGKYEDGAQDGDEASACRYEAINRFIDRFKDEKEITPDVISALQELKESLSSDQDLWTLRANEDAGNLGFDGLDEIIDNDPEAKEEVKVSVKQITGGLI